MNPDLIKYFASPTAAAEFALLHTDGETRQQLLGITRLHYRDESASTSWAERIVKLDLSSDAQREADLIHLEMIAR